jgi:hypothetical protein
MRLLFIGIFILKCNGATESSLRTSTICNACVVTWEVCELNQDSTFITPVLLILQVNFQAFGWTEAHGTG